MNTDTRSMSHNWVRVSRRNPCPVCQKPDWCSISPDGKFVWCERIRNTTGDHDGKLHRLTPNFIPPRPPAKPETRLPIASIETRDRVYRALLAELPLSDDHGANLLRRGLSPDEIKALGYATLPQDGRTAVVTKLTKTMKVGGVPGFALVNGQVTLCGKPGILIPVRDAAGRIRACQIRLDDPNGNGKYRWLSSASKPYGCSSGAPCHVAQPLMGTDSNEVWITEGPLKADIAAIGLNKVVIAVPGVGQWRNALPIISELKATSVVVAYDMDKLTNPAVNQYKEALINHLRRRGIPWGEANWDARFKGIDDLIVSEG